MAVRGVGASYQWHATPELGEVDITVDAPSGHVFVANSAHVLVGNYNAQFEDATDICPMIRALITDLAEGVAPCQAVDCDDCEAP